MALTYDSDDFRIIEINRPWVERWVNIFSSKNSTLSTLELESLALLELLEVKRKLEVSGQTEAFGRIANRTIRSALIDYARSETGRKTKYYRVIYPLMREFENLFHKSATAKDLAFHLENGKWPSAEEAILYQSPGILEIAEEIADHRALGASKSLDIPLAGSEDYTRYNLYAGKIEPSSGSDAHTHEQLSALQAEVFAALGPTTKEIVELRLYEALDTSQIAERLKLPIPTVNAKFRIFKTVMSREIIARGWVRVEDLPPEVVKDRQMLPPLLRCPELQAVSRLSETEKRNFYAHLSPQGRGLIERLLRGERSRQIALDLGVTESAVFQVRKNTFAKIRDLLMKEEAIN